MQERVASGNVAVCIFRCCFLVKCRGVYVLDVACVCCPIFQIGCIPVDTERPFASYGAKESKTQMHTSGEGDTCP